MPERRRSRSDDDESTNTALQVAMRLYAVAYSTLALLFAASAITLVAFAIDSLWGAVAPDHGGDRASAVVDAIGLLAIALVAFEMSQTVIEEEVVRQAQVSAPTRVRRFLSRFLVVVVVALAIETLVAVFKVIHEDAARLPYVATLGVAAAAILAAWGYFIRANRAAEELEPEALARAKREDPKLG
jgi:hypothetical protein